MAFYIERLDKKDGRPVPLAEGTTSLGRNPRNTIALPADDRCVSGYHALIYVMPDKLLLQDMQSTNGTFVNDQRIEDECAIKEGDVIGLGMSGPKFRVVRSVYAGEGGADVGIVSKHYDIGGPQTLDPPVSPTITMKTPVIPAFAPVAPTVAVKKPVVPKYVIGAAAAAVVLTALILVVSFTSGGASKTKPPSSPSQKFIFKRGEPSIGDIDDDRISYKKVKDMLKENNVEREITNYVFVKDGRKHFAPQYISPNTTTTKWIFSIPEPNAVGTLDKQSNSVTFMKFLEYGKDPECSVVALNCGRSISDSFRYRFSPNYADGMIIYARTEDVVITNINDGEAFCVSRSLPESNLAIKDGKIHYVDNDLPEDINVEQFCVDDETFNRVPVPADGKCVYPATIANYVDGMRVYTNVELDIEDDDPPKDPCYMIAVSFLNSQNKLFTVVNRLNVLNEDDDEYGFADFLQVVMLEDNRLINTAWIMHLGSVGKESDGGILLHQTWFVHNQTLFAYDSAKHQMLCTDGNRSVLHPFVEMFNNNANNISTVKDLALHPKLPFGIMIEENTLKKQCLVTTIP